MSKLTVGADPEFFLKDKETGKYKPAIGMIGGTKEDPRPISEEGHAIQEDNVMVEFNVPPSETSEELYENIQYVLDYLKENVVPNNFEFAFKPSALFDAEDLKHPQAMESGCDPDFDAWSEAVNDPPPMSDMEWRFSGGHIHFGYENPSIPKSLKIIKTADLMLGVPSVLLDTDEERRKYYGKAGTFRIKPYGVEYRTLSNFWVNDKDLIDYVMTQSKNILDFVESGETINEQTANNIQKSINTVDKKLAEKICNKYKLL